MGSKTIKEEMGPKTVKEVFIDFRGRHTAIIKALTTEKENFCQQCDPDKENLCLYGFPDEIWAVTLPSEEVPADLPEPAIGINFARDGMVEEDWLRFVAVQCDAWLLSVAFFLGMYFLFNKNKRTRLFNLINELPTILEVVTGTVKESKTTKAEDEQLVEEEEEAQEEPSDYLCEECLKEERSNEFWICCDICDRWFHGKCVKITPAKAKHIGQYKCPSCSNKRARV